MTMLIVDHVSKNFGSLQAANNICFEIKQGDIVGFLGVMGLLLTRYVPRAAKQNTIEIPLMLFVSLAVLWHKALQPCAVGIWCRPCRE